MSDHEEPGVPGAAEGSAEPTRSARVTAAQKEEQLSFMTEHPLLARHATDLSSVLTRDEKQRLWEQLARRLNALGPPTKSSKQWKEHWSRRVMKARKRAAVLNEAARRTGGGSSTVCPLASSLARILTLVGTDSAFGAPGVRVPAEPDDQQSRQERHDAAAIQAVEQQALLLQQNTDQAAEEREFRGRVQAQTKPYAHCCHEATESSACPQWCRMKQSCGMSKLHEVLERISSHLDRTASGLENTHSTLVQLLLLLASRALEQPAAPAHPAAPAPAHPATRTGPTPLLWSQPFPQPWQQR
ncbi:hypothetical protein HPB47_004134 [Ixodes persulcatus]|uniref:Uncharacterized protein n=1 Tax=Ixodes persulcatus TaxID=34615 RepID=A0AC60PGQ6_IXOPE|nr:hypothetical protein HPB47_004134 [Ixodes persulcatus]